MGSEDGAFQEALRVFCIARLRRVLKTWESRAEGFRLRTSRLGSHEKGPSSELGLRGFRHMVPGMGLWGLGRRILGLGFWVRGVGFGG